MSVGDWVKQWNFLLGAFQNICQSCRARVLWGKTNWLNRYYSISPDFPKQFAEFIKYLKKLLNLFVRNKTRELNVDVKKTRTRCISGGSGRDDRSFNLQLHLPMVASHSWAWFSRKLNKSVWRGDFTRSSGGLSSGGSVRLTLILQGLEKSVVAKSARIADQRYRSRLRLLLVHGMGPSWSI